MIKEDILELLQNYGLYSEDLTEEQISKYLDDIINYNNILIDLKKQEIMELVSN